MTNGCGVTGMVQFVTLAAARGIDLFRIFDCFNDVSQMKVSIDAVRKVRVVGTVEAACVLVL